MKIYIQDNFSLSDDDIEPSINIIEFASRQLILHKNPAMQFRHQIYLSSLPSTLQTVKRGLFFFNDKLL